MKVGWRYSGCCCCCCQNVILLVLNSHSHFRRHQQAAEDEVKLIKTSSSRLAISCQRRRPVHDVGVSSRRRPHDDQFIGISSRSHEFTTTSSLAQIHNNDQFIGSSQRCRQCRPVHWHKFMTTTSSSHNDRHELIASLDDCKSNLCSSGQFRYQNRIKYRSSWYYGQE